MSREPLTLAKLLRQAALPFIAGALAATYCWIACGATLGLYFGGVVMAVLLLPPLVARDERITDALITAAALIGGIAIVWLIAAAKDFSLLQWLQAYIVLAAVGIALLAMQMSLRRTMTTILFLAWLAWPIWLSPWMNAKLVAILAPVHPLFALNRVFIDSGVWTQQPLMYQLTSLGQDVPYALPRSILACAFAHVLTGLALGLPAWWWSRPAGSAARPPAASPAA